MLFGEIALRLQLLTQAQIEACIRAQEERSTPASLRTLALELGLVGDEEVGLVDAQFERVLDRRRAARPRESSAPRNVTDTEARATGEQVNQRWSAPEPQKDPRATGERVNQRWGVPGQQTARSATGGQVNQRFGEPGTGTTVTQAEPADTDGASAWSLSTALAIAFAHGASDLHIHSGAVPMMRIDAQLVPLPGGSLPSAGEVQSWILEMLDEPRRDALAAHGQTDFAWTVPTLGRARVSAYRTRRGLDAVLRLIPPRPPRLVELGLPPALTQLVEARAGLILCTGPHGSGKSATLAALLGEMIQSRDAHVITIENPVEHVFEPGRALVRQREVGTHTGSSARALRAALREDPDVIAVMDLRDAETIGLAMTAAETGHLVIGALPTGSASETVHHIVSAFGAEQREQARVMLSETLRAVVCQRLVPRASGTGRVAAVELVLANPTVRNLIRQDRLPQLHAAVQSGKGEGMTTFDDSLTELVRTGIVTAEAAWRFAHRRERFGVA